MKKFDWTKFSIKIAVKSDLKTMYAAWTKPFEIEKWFLYNADYFDEDDNLVDKKDYAQKGHSYEWSWFLWEGVEKGKITAVNGVDKIQFTFAGKCTVDIILSSLEGNTLVELFQYHIPTDDESKVNIRLGCHTGWSFYLVNLKSVYEGGLDLRNKDVDLKGMTNS